MRLKSLLKKPFHAWIGIGLSMGVLFFPVTGLSVVVFRSENTVMDLGLRLAGIFSTVQVTQPQRRAQEETDVMWDTFFTISQARLRMSASLYNRVRLFLQTDIRSHRDISSYINLLDALFVYRFHQAFSVYMGIHLPPSHRESITSSLTSLTLERPLVSTKPITWFNQGIAAYFNDQHNPQGNYFQNIFVVRTARMPYRDRDIGVTLYGSHSLNSWLHMKYYSGYYDGAVALDRRQPQFLRTTQRLQINLLNGEPNYFSYGTYLGEIKTVALGASFDYQNQIPLTAPSTNNTRYMFYSGDLFMEFPVYSKNYALSMEASYSFLDLNRMAPTKEGHGGYVQMGILTYRLLTWMSYERWQSYSKDFGSFNGGRLGMTYFFWGHDFKLSAGWEFIRADEFDSFSDHNTFSLQIKMNI